MIKPPCPQWVERGRSLMVLSGMLPRVDVQQIAPDAIGLPALREEAALDGFRFLERLVNDWAGRINRFEAPGEKLIGAFVAEKLVGVAGLSREPFEPAPGRARLRHLYVLQAFRRMGVGGTLVRHLLEEASEVFDEMRLRTDTAEAAAFYERLGFNPVLLDTATHVRVL
jgi:GNAT superfamily N-acetyltransferase